MRATVVYESLFGSTREVAEAVAEGLRAAAPGAAVDCRPVVDAGPALGQVDLLVVGGPTHFLGMSSQRSRRIVCQYQERAGGRRPRQAAGKHPAGPGVREWLAALPRRQVAAGRRRSIPG
ncbi:MAG TPA: flavodoxin domain-containing protein [Streptosporangiaceae bacterium]